MKREPNFVFILEILRESNKRANNQVNKMDAKQQQRKAPRFFIKANQTNTKDNYVDAKKDQCGLISLKKAILNSI